MTLLPRGRGGAVKLPPPFLPLDLAEEGLSGRRLRHSAAMRGGAHRRHGLHCLHPPPPLEREERERTERERE